MSFGVITRVVGLVRARNPTWACGWALARSGGGRWGSSRPKLGRFNLRELTRPFSPITITPFTMSAPRTFARKALASASSARAFSTVLAARPAAAQAVRAAVAGPRMTVRSPSRSRSPISPQISWELELPLRDYLLYTRTRADLVFSFFPFCLCAILLARHLSNRSTFLVLPALASVISSLPPHRPPSHAFALILQRGVKNLDFAGTKEDVYERGDWPLPKLQE